MKKGFTLIELVFTIVILAITTMAIPRIVAQTVNLNMFAVQQELVYSAKFMVSRVQPAIWDSAYDSDCVKECSENVIHSIGAAKESRPGILRDGANGNRKLDSITDAKPTSESDFGIGGSSVPTVRNDEYPYVDIDDYDGFERTEKTSRSYRGDNVFDIKTSVNVKYVPDPLVSKNNGQINANFGIADNATPTDVKLVEVEAKNIDEGDNGTSVKLRYYTFNIGSSRPESTPIKVK
ncbi:type II secretion system GspH family protein [Campylobacter sp. JMF_01 NE2]|uniref:pilus assembly FimT family protein n=1 Tax=unclassified Campylobacter TaxID=2593542 RepID=UPI0022E9D2A6|nr:MULTISPECIES: type II secretion system protein [unclassified Campylobacter]MDA3053045.1 type II secretion system GspH family protein [Campylobacter sp. JMF_03 NE3]MDA3067376.1 type II secretion system GspH family protein [Campylobacter sp. JMF_01 NE2]